MNSSLKSPVSGNPYPTGLGMEEIEPLESKKPLPKTVKRKPSRRLRKLQINRIVRLKSSLSCTNLPEAPVPRNLRKTNSFMIQPDDKSVRSQSKCQELVELKPGMTRNDTYKAILEGKKLTKDKIVGDTITMFSPLGEPK